MSKFENGKIYKLWSPSKNLVYYGSTIQSLSQRLAGHIRNKNCMSLLVLECEDYKIELVEDCPCNNRQQLLKKEGEYIRNNNCINKNIPNRTMEEWNNDNKEKRKLQKKAYNEKNKELLKIQHKEYYEKNKEKTSEQAKKYYYLNRDKISEKHKEYYLKKKEERDNL